MGQKEKLIERLKSRPKDFTFDELQTLLSYFSYKRLDKGKTSGSRVIFIKEGSPSIMMHKPHPRKELLAYQIKQIVDFLEKEGLI